MSRAFSTSTVFAIALAATAFTSCFNGAGALNLPCTESNQCGLGQSCIDGFCDGPPDDFTECGNGVIEDGEECDAGPNNDDEAECKSDCTDQACGDGFIGPGEGCDDGNTVSGDMCSATCSVEDCGNGEVDEGEECDNGAGGNVENSNCTPNCTTATCGDGFVWTDDGEECDAGPDESETSECDSDCTTPSCGDGLVNIAFGEAEGCDPPPATEAENANCLDNCRAPLFFEGAEGPLGDQWEQIFISGPHPTAWNFGTQEAFAGVKSIHSGLPPDDMNNLTEGPGQSQLRMTDSIELPAGQQYVLRFHQLPDFALCGDTFADGGRMMISVDGGEFVTIPGHPDMIMQDMSCAALEGNPLEDGEPCFTVASLPGNGTFQRFEFDLSRYAGSTIQIALDVTWDCADCPPAGTGWWVDNLSIYADPVF